MRMGWDGSACNRWVQWDGLRRDSWGWDGLGNRGMGAMGIVETRRFGMGCGCGRKGSRKGQFGMGRRCAMRRVEKGRFRMGRRCRWDIYCIG